MEDILPFCFLAKRLRTPVADGDGAKSMSSNAPNLIWRATGSFDPLGNRSPLSFWFSFWGDGLFLSTREICSGWLCASGSCGFLGSYAWKTCRSRFRQWLLFSILELELTDLFTEVSGSIWVSQACVEQFFLITFKAEGLDGIFGFGTWYMLTILLPLGK